MTEDLSSKDYGKRFAKQLATTFALAATTWASISLANQSIELSRQETIEARNTAYTNAGVLFTELYSPLLSTKTMDDLTTLSESDPNISVLKDCLQSQWDQTMLVTTPVLVDGELVAPLMASVRVDNEQASLCFQEQIAAKAASASKKNSSYLATGGISALAIVIAGSLTLMAAGYTVASGYGFANRKKAERAKTDSHLAL